MTPSSNRTDTEEGGASEMVERVAKAIHDQWLASYQFGHIPPMSSMWEQLSASDREYGLGLARAAILAMRPATDAMTEAGGNVIIEGRDHMDGLALAANSYDRMISTALVPTGGGDGS